MSVVCQVCRLMSDSSSFYYGCEVMWTRSGRSTRARRPLRRRKEKVVRAVVALFLPLSKCWPAELCGTRAASIAANAIAFWIRSWPAMVPIATSTANCATPKSTALKATASAAVPLSWWATRFRKWLIMHAYQLLYIFHLFNDVATGWRTCPRCMTLNQSRPPKARAALDAADLSLRLSKCSPKDE